MRSLLRLMPALILGLSLLPSVQAAQQSAAAIRQAAETFAKQQTAHLSGQVSVTVGAIEQAQLAPCANLQAFLPLGAKLWGNSNIGVRCSPLAGGQQLTAEDLSLQVAELTQLPAGVLSTVQEAVGKVLSSGVVAGNPLRQDMLRAPILVHQGQSVRLVAQGQGFKVSSEGRALSNGAAGQQVQVKAQNGQTVSGVVQPDGTIEVQY
jgi:flagellar basal body P-ring formation protein FlgA